MPPKITRVRWKAQDLPWGIQFNERTGTFSGTPEDAGEYIVPVTVETNYGTDTKDVKIVVEPPIYGVYAIGPSAATWANGGEPDEDGFYGLVMPKAYELLPHHTGFGALTSGYKYYCCGPYAPVGGNSISLRTASTPVCLYDQIVAENISVNLDILSKVDRVIQFYYVWSHSTGGTDSSKQEGRTGQALVLWNSSLQQGLRLTTKVEYTTVSWSRNYGTSTSVKWEAFPSGSALVPSNVSINDKKILLDDIPYINLSTYPGVAYISDDNTIWQRNNKAIPQTNLGYTAIKVFDGRLFKALSESHYLDNKPDNFIHGEIKDAWGRSSVFYVQTTGNQLYEYVSSSQTWNLVGTYDIKKVQVYSSAQIYLLTNDGELYHKGTTIKGLFDEAHTTLTRIFPTLTFKDFTFGGNTLTVLRE